MNMATATTGASALGQLAGGIGQASQANANAKLLKRIGAIEANEVRRDTRRFISRQQQAAAASGIVANTGSALAVQSESAVEGEVAALRAQFAQTSRARAIKAEGRAALISSIGAAGKTILGGAAKQLGRGGSSTAKRTPVGTNIEFDRIA